MKRKLRVALVHDYLSEYGGAERVVEALHEIFPEAPLFTAFVDRERLGEQWQRFADWDIRESWLSKIPFHKRLFSPLRIWSPSYFGRFDLTGYDVIISSTNAYFAKAVQVPEGVKHFCYCHTPSRSLWGYSTMTDWKKNPIIRIGGELINHYLRIKDVEIARNNVDVFIANSKETQRRIKKFYRLESTVVYPPVTVPDKQPAMVSQFDESRSPEVDRQDYYLYVNRLAWSKHPEIAVQACTRLELPLIVVGTGKMEAHLRSIAGPTIQFLGFVSDEKLSEIYRHARALLYPVADEDFGMVPVEAMGFGVPVIAHRSGGPLETVVDGRTGILFDELSETGLQSAITRFEKMKFDRSKIHEHAKHFDKRRFQEKILDLISSA